MHYSVRASARISGREWDAKCSPQRTRARAKIDSRNCSKISTRVSLLSERKRCLAGPRILLLYRGELSVRVLCAVCKRTSFPLATVSLRRVSFRWGLVIANGLFFFLRECVNKHF